MRRKTTSATTARNRSDPTTAPAISGALSVEVGGVATMLVVVEDEKPGFVGMEDTCALVVAVVAPTTIADVDVGVVAVGVVVVAAIVDAVVVTRAVADVVVDVAAAVVNAFVVAVVGRLAAVQLATGRLVQEHGERLVEQSCGFA